MTQEEQIQYKTNTIEGRTSQFDYTKSLNNKTRNMNAEVGY